MEENFNLQNCGADDALLSQDKAFKIAKVKQVVKETFCNVLAPYLHNSLKEKGVEIHPGVKVNGLATSNWFDKGVDCELLKVGAKGWQKGKVIIKVSLEFIPDEPEILETPASNHLENGQPQSPLDDLRKMIDQSN